MRLNEFKNETVISIDMKLSTLNSNKLAYSYDQPSADLIKWTLLKSPGKYYHSSQFTKHISSITLEDDTLIHLE